MIIQITLASIIAICFLVGSLSFEVCVMALNTWFEKLVPSLFVTTVLIRVLQDIGFFKTLSNKFCRFSLPLLNISPQSFSIIINSFLLGAPCTAALINSLCHEKKISEKMGRRICTCCCMATPSFIINTCGIVLLKDFKIGLILWLSQIVACLFLLFFTRNTKIEMNEDNKKLPLFDSLQKNILETWKTLFLIGGYLMVTLVIVSALTFFTPQFFQETIKCVTEFTYGCNAIASSKLVNTFKILLICALLSFNGITTWIQVFSLSPSCKPHLLSFASARVLHILISCTFIWLTGVL